MRQDVALVGSLGEVSRDLSSFVSRGVVLTIGAYLQSLMEENVAAVEEAEVI